MIIHAAVDTRRCRTPPLIALASELRGIIRNFSLETLDLIGVWATTIASHVSSAHDATCIEATHPSSIASYDT